MLGGHTRHVLNHFYLLAAGARQIVPASTGEWPRHLDHSRRKAEMDRSQE